MNHYKDAQRDMRWMNPHVWFKFQQAQANFIKALNEVRSGRNPPKRRIMKWCRAMNHWAKPMMECMENSRP